MIKKLMLLLLVCYSANSFAETIKTDVLVIGNTPGGVCAAVQSARSKLKTIIIIPGAKMEAFRLGKDYTITSNRNLPSGLWNEFRDRVIDFYRSTTGYDANSVTLKFESSTGSNILEKLADTVKNLTIKLNTVFTSVKKDGTGWDITITENGLANTIKTKVLIDGTEKAEVIARAGATLPPAQEHTWNYDNELYRTAIAVSDLPHHEYIPVRDVVIPNADNLLAMPAITDDVQYLPLQMELGQGIGTVAAYIAFFKTTTKNLKTRIIQQELLDFRGYLVPFADVKNNNRYIRAVQQIGATGMLKGKQTKDGLLFMPDVNVNTEEIKPVLTEIYSRAFLWFNKEKPGDKFTIGNALSLVSEMTLSEPQTLQITMKVDWTTKYHFTSDFDINRPITRLEFAVLINKFLNPFARTVDLAGNSIN